MLERIKDCQHRLSDWVIRKNPWIGLERRAEGFVRLFEPCLKPGSTILDIGAGPGVYYEPLSRRGHAVTLLDVKRYKACRHPIVFYDGARIPFGDKTFDASMLVTVLHHTVDPAAVLREAKRVSRGQVIVIEDIYATPFGRMNAILRDALLNFEFIGHPMNFKTKTAWRGLFEQEGFSVLEEHDFHSFLLGLPIRTGLFILGP